MASTISLALASRRVLLADSVVEKTRLAAAAAELAGVSSSCHQRASAADRAPIGVDDAPMRPARPALPQLVPQKQVPTPKQSELPLNVYMLHNLAHVEMNAIDLASDTVVRFSRDSEDFATSCYGMPWEFYADFTEVAADEARHLGWCVQRLKDLGYDYGCMPAHDSLWQCAEATRECLEARLAVVPMVQEARGLDAGDRLVEKLRGFADHESAEIVAQIASEEVGHVAVGVKWFRYICDKQRVDAKDTFARLVKQYGGRLLKGPFNVAARDLAGLPREWYEQIAL